jgi:L-lactate utilization protein LutC
VMAILESEAVRSVLVSPDAAGEPWRCAPPALWVVRDAASPGRKDALAADAGITVAAYGLADTGTLVLCSSEGDHRLDSLLPPLHIAILRARDIVPDLPALFDRLAAERRFDKHSAITLVRGPSRTADIELALTVGVHGPERVRVVIAGC